MKVSSQQIIDDVWRVGKVVGRIPNCPDYKRHGHLSLNTVKRRFGSWNKCTMQLFGEVARHRHQPTVERECEHEPCHNKFTCKLGSGRRFCSMACSNRAVKRRRKKKEWVCVDCGAPTRRKRRMCTKCRKDASLANKTLGEIRARRNDAARYSTVRGHARSVARDIPDKCVVCGYDKYVQVCHVVPISELSDRTKVGEVNVVKNLVKLCPNHHWEHDHGLLKWGSNSGLVAG